MCFQMRGVHIWGGEGRDRCRRNDAESSDAEGRRSHILQSGTEILGWCLSVSLFPLNGVRGVACVAWAGEAGRGRCSGNIAGVGDQLSIGIAEHGALASHVWKKQTVASKLNGKTKIAIRKPRAVLGHSSLPCSGKKNPPQTINNNSIHQPYVKFAAHHCP